MTAEVGSLSPKLIEKPPTHKGGNASVTQTCFQRLYRAYFGVAYLTSLGRGGGLTLHTYLTS